MKIIHFIFPFLVIYSIFPNFIGCEATPATTEELEIVDKLKEELLKVGKSGRGLSLSKDELDTNFIESYLDYNSDAVLLNWIRFYDYDMGKILKALTKNLKWRKINKIDQLVDWKVPKYLIETQKYHLMGLNDRGVPVMYLPAGNWNIREALTLGHQQDMVKRGLKQLEEILQKINLEVGLLNETTGQVPFEGVGRFIAIADVKNFSIAQAVSIRTMTFYSSLLRLYETYYPLLGEKVFIINAPSFFVSGLNLVKSLLDAKSLQLLEMYGEDENEWKKVLFNYLPKKLIPKKIYGEGELVYNDI